MLKPQDIVLVVANDNGNGRFIVPQAFGIDTSLEDIGPKLEQICCVEPPFVYFDREDLVKEPLLAGVSSSLSLVLPRPLTGEDLHWALCNDKPVEAVVAIPWEIVAGTSINDLASRMRKLVAGNSHRRLREMDHRPVGLVDTVVLVEVKARVCAVSD